MKTPTLFLLLLLILPIQVVAQFQLEWSDSGHVVWPGTRFTVQFHAEGSRLLGGLADAGISINNLLFGISECGTWWDPHACIVMGGHQHDLGSIPLGKYQWDVTMYFTIDCDGRMVVEVLNYGYAHEYLVPQKELPVMYFSESNPALSSSVIVGRVEVFRQCNAMTTTYTGTLPAPGSGSEGGEPTSWLSWKLVLLVFGAGLVLFFTLLITVLVLSVLRR